MTEAIKRNPIILRSCILYQFSKGKPIFETFKKLCRKFGEDFMNYPEFEYWFMRFSQGNFDLDHDRKCILRKVSKDIQVLVDSWDPEVIALKYMDGYDSRHMYSSCWKICRKSRVYKNFDDSDENLLDLFKNPKLRLNKLSILCSDDKKKEIIKLLERSNQKIRVKLLNIDDNLLQKPTIFHMFDGKALKEVTVRIKERYSIQNLDELDVFKKLEMLTICTDFCPSDPTLLYNFPRLTITFCGNCKEEEVSRFIKNLLQSTQLQICYLSCMWNSVDFGLIKSYFVEPETMVSDLPNIRRYLIPSTNEFYEINFGEKKICIKRKQ